MRLLGMPRDYIASFIVEPGRTLTPAVYAEIENEEFASEIQPASVDVVRGYVWEKIAAVRATGTASYTKPTSPWRIQQALLWSKPDQNNLFPNEGYETEFKVTFKTDERSILKYAKTLAAFSNHQGGYIFFGVANDGAFVDFDPQRFLDHDWLRFDQIVENHFEPYVSWEIAVAEVPEGDEIRLDEQQIMRMAKKAGVGRESYQWLIDAGHMGAMKHIGILYAYQSDRQPVVSTRSKKGQILEGHAYRRLRARNVGFPVEEYVKKFGSRDGGTTAPNPQSRFQEFLRRLRGSENRDEGQGDLF